MFDNNWVLNRYLVSGFLGFSVSRNYFSTIKKETTQVARLDLRSDWIYISLWFARSMYSHVFKPFCFCFYYFYVRTHCSLQFVCVGGGMVGKVG